MGFFLFIVSWILGVILFTFSVIFTPVYYLVTLKWKTGAKKLDSYFLLCATSIDQTGNTLCAEVLNLALLKRGPAFMKFGNMDDTISYVIGVNKYENNLTRAGWILERILHALDNLHVEKAIISKLKSDQEAQARYWHGNQFYPFARMRQTPGAEELIKQYYQNQQNENNRKKSKRPPGK